MAPASSRALAAVDLDYFNEILAYILACEWPCYADWKLWIGFILWFGVIFKWVRYGYRAVYWVKAVYTLGMNLMLLSFVQHFGTTGIYLCSGPILLQTAISTWLFWKPSDILRSGVFSSMNIYEDIGGPGLQVVFLFLGQLSLLLMYFCALFRAADTTTRNYNFWVVSYLAIQMSAFFNRGANSQLGQVWNGSLWLAILQNARQVSFSYSAFGGKETHFRVSRWEMVGRGFAGVIVNNMFREALAFTVPIMLMFLSDPFEFVGSCLALNFIVTLDDMEAKEYKVLVESSTLDLEVGRSFSAVQDKPASPTPAKLPATSSRYSMKDTWSGESPRTVVPGQVVARSDPNITKADPDESGSEHSSTAAEAEDFTLGPGHPSAPAEPVDLS